MTKKSRFWLVNISTTKKYFVKSTTYLDSNFISNIVAFTTLLAKKCECKFPWNQLLFLTTFPHCECDKWSIWRKKDTIIFCTLSFDRKKLILQFGHQCHFGNYGISLSPKVIVASNQLFPVISTLWVHLCKNDFFGKTECLVFTEFLVTILFLAWK